jgi:dethiobiotin synthetase
MNRGVFVTGTDTGVGKTVASCALIHAMRDRGVAVHPFKPIAAGAIAVTSGWMNEDTLRLLEAAALDISRADDVTPILLRDPLAPHIAAEREGRAIDLGQVRDALARVSPETFVVAEGVGGFLVPLGERLDTIELCRLLAMPIVMVVGMRLGCLNHALLTQRAIASCGFHLKGWIANRIDPAMLAAEENIATLAARLPAPLLGCLPHCAKPEARELAAYLDVSPLLS